MTREQVRRSATIGICTIVLAAPVLGLVALAEHLIEKDLEVRNLQSRLTAAAHRAKPSIELSEKRLKILVEATSARSGELAPLNDEQALARLQSIVKASTELPVQVTTFRILPVTHENTASTVRGTVTLRAPAETIFEVVSQIEQSTPFLIVESLQVISNQAGDGRSQNLPVEMTLALALHFIRTTTVPKP